MAGNGGYDRQQAARQELDALLMELNRISSSLSRLAEQVREAESARPGWDRAGTFPRWAARFGDGVRQLIATLHALVEAGPGQPPDLAFSATAQLSALKSAVGGAPPLWPYDDRPPTVLLSTQQLEGYPWARAQEDALIRASTGLWSLISHLTRVKEWSISGTVDTGPLGMAQAQISVTFG